jgi:hypothetical protein
MPLISARFPSSARFVDPLTMPEESLPKPFIDLCCGTMELARRVAASRAAISEFSACSREPALHNPPARYSTSPAGRILLPVAFCGNSTRAGLAASCRRSASALRLTGRDLGKNRVLFPRVVKSWEDAYRIQISRDRVKRGSGNSLVLVPVSIHSTFDCYLYNLVTKVKNNLTNPIRFLSHSRRVSVRDSHR